MEFLPGLELSRRFYSEVVRPRLPEGLVHAAALIGPGSEVLGFDTPMSMDHDWGPRVQIFLAHEARVPEVRERISTNIPSDFLGFPISVSGNEVTTLDRFLTDYLGFDARREIHPADWLSVSEQKLRSLTAGAVFHDAIGLTDLRERLAYFPDDVWRYQLASLWERIGQEEHLVGRAGYVGDELGAAVIAGRLVRDLMRLAFALERVYAPYPKWFGTAFRRLASGKELEPQLMAVLRAPDWKSRDAALAAAYRIVARLQNEMGIVPPKPEEPDFFFERPFRVIHLHTAFAEALRTGIEDPEVRRIAARRNIGGIDVFSDSTDLLAPSEWFPKVRSLYEKG